MVWRAESTSSNTCGVRSSRMFALPTASPKPSSTRRSAPSPGRTARTWHRTRSTCGWRPGSGRRRST